MRTDIRLPCLATEGNCQTNTATYVWNETEEEDWCPYYFIRNVTGIAIMDKAGIEVFISTDKTGYDRNHLQM